MNRNAVSGKILYLYIETREDIDEVDCYHIAQAFVYDPFGNEVKADKKDDNPFRYCGEYYDKETEEIYLRARYYQPVVGRFITRDTYTGEDDEPLSLHLYAYCYNNPVYYIDYMGNTPVKAQPTPIPKTVKESVPINGPQPGPAPKKPPKQSKRKSDFTWSSSSEKAAEKVLSATRYKGTTALETGLALKHYKKI